MMAKKNKNHPQSSSTEKLREDNLTQHILTIQEAEREKFARLLHGNVGQILTGAALKSKHLVNRLERTNPSLARDARVQCELINQALNHLRMISRGVSKYFIHESSLQDALTSLCRSMAQLSETSCSLSLDSDLDVLEGEFAEGLYLIAQEAVINSVRHACSKSLEVNLFKYEAQVCLEIQDRGVGLLNEQVSGFGFITMEQAAEEIGAELIVNELDVGGLRVFVSVPIERFS